jgi:xylulokinase
MRERALIGVDIGTTAVKAVMADLSGRRLAAYAAAYPTARPGPGLVEQDPFDWLGHVEAALAQFAAVGAEVLGIGVTGQVNTHVFCDPGFALLAPAIVWQDRRAAAAGAALEAGITVADKTAALGAPIPIDASHALARMAWMAAERPKVWAATAHVIAPKDWVIARLTGVAGADPLASVGLVGTDLTYAGAVLGLMARAGDVLPPLSDPLDPAGVVQAGPFAGVPVVRGTMDAWAAMFGVGVARNGQAMNLSGTSEVLGLISATRNPVPGVITFPAWRGITLHAGPTQGGGASLDWLGRIVGRDAAALTGLTEGVAIAADSPLFLPHLDGERAPLWDSAAKGTFAGLTNRTGPGEMVVAVMEGVAFSARLAMEALEAAGGMRPGVIRAGGGGTVADRWCQIRADVFGRPLVRMQARDCGAVGAVVLAGVGAGVTGDLAAGAAALVPEDRRFLPDPDAAVLADQRFTAWKELYSQIRPVNARLGSATSG